MTSEITRREFLAGAAAGAILTAVPRPAFGANERIRLGIIGVGSRGNYHIGEILKLEKSLNMEAAAICDTWKQQREQAVARVAKATGRECRSFVNYKDLLALPDVDAVVIASPDFSHARILMDALKAGKDVYVEKPFASELADARDALDAALASKQVVQVGTQRRSEGRWKEAVKAIRSGVLGTVSRIEVAWNDCGPRWSKGKFEIDEKDVDWEGFLMGHRARPWDPHQYHEWQLYREFTNGPLALLGTHSFDLVSWLMDDPTPSSAVAHGGIYVWKDNREHEDTVTALLEYPKGFLCQYTTSLGNEGGQGTRIYGTNGMFSDQTWKITGDGSRQPGRVKQEIVIADVQSEHHMTNWIDCIRSRGVPNAPAQTGYNHAVASVLCFRALREGRKLRYLPDRREIVAG